MNGWSPYQHDQAVLEPRISAAERLLARVWVRLILSVLIITSLVPHPFEDGTDLLFLGVFGLEFLLRTFLLFGRFREPPRPDARIRRARGAAFSGLVLLFDLFAVLSFVPWADLIGSGHDFLDGPILRIFRLLRLWMLVSYWSPMFKDALGVLARHDRLKQVAVLGLLVGVLALAGATVLSHIPVDVDFDGDTRVTDADANFWPRFWWAFRQIQDPGNLVVDPREIAVVAISLLLTVAGLFVVSFLIGVATDTVRELVDIARNRPVGWRAHTVVVGAPPHLTNFIADLSAYYERLFRRPRFVVTDLDSPPPSTLRTHPIPNLKWRSTDRRGTGLIEVTDVARARRVIIHARPEAPFPDAQVAATILDIREASQSAWIVAEVLEPHSAAAVRVAGGPRTIAVPTETLLGLWVLAEVRRPEQLPIAWELLVTRSGFEIFTFYFDADGLDGPGRPWAPGDATFEGLIREGLAASSRTGGRIMRVMPIGFVSAKDGSRSHDHGELVLNPRPGRLTEGAPVRAIIGIAEQFGPLRKLGEGLLEGRALTPLAGLQSPELEPPRPPLRPKRLLLCGFRAGTVVTCAGLCAEGEDVEITVLMRHEESLGIATEALREHGERTSSSVGSPSLRCFTGEFVPESEGVFRWAGDGVRGGRVRLVQADWSSARTLSGREPGVEHVGQYDLVMLLGAHLPEYDGRTAMAVLKIADLMRLEPAQFSADFRVICGVADTDLGRRLLEGFKRTTGRHLEVLPTEALRSQFMFQSVAVPGWEAIYTELLSSGGQSLVCMKVRKGQPEREMTIAELALGYRERGLLVIGAEISVDGQNVRKLLPKDEGVRFGTHQLHAVWAICPEDGRLSGS